MKTRPLHGVSGCADRVLEGDAQVLLVERLKQALNGTSSEKIRAEVSIGVTRDEDNRDVQFTTAQFALQLRSRHARHRHVQYQTLSVSEHIGSQKSLCRSKGYGSKPKSPQKIGQRLARRHIVIDHRYQGTFPHISQIKPAAPQRESDPPPRRESILRSCRQV